MSFAKLSVPLIILALSGCANVDQIGQVARPIIPSGWDPTELDSPIEQTYSEDARSNVFRASDEGNDLADIVTPNGTYGALIPYGAVWGPGSNLRVCFYNGSPQLRSFVAGFADKWNLIGANVTLDFGNMQSPRTCTGQEYSAIRIAFNQGGGNSSYIGREAITAAPRWDLPTMFLQPSTMGQRYVAEATIKHEFGHALGLIHEHQRPGSIGCGDEIDFERAYLAFRPWSVEQVRHNLAPYNAPYPVETDTLDTSSIMMYNLPSNALYRGENSRCFAPFLNYQITEGDRNVLKAAYSEEVQADVQRMIRQQAMSARDAGDLDVVRAYAVLAQPYDVIESLAEAYEREGEFDFEPAPGEDARTLLGDRIDAFVENLGQ